MKTKSPQQLKDSDQCKVVGGTHAGKSGMVTDINTSKPGISLLPPLCKKTVHGLKH